MGIKIIYGRKLHCNPQAIKHKNGKTQKYNAELKMIEKTCFHQCIWHTQQNLPGKSDKIKDLGLRFL